MGSAIAIVTTKTLSMTEGNPYSANTHTGSNRSTVEGSHEGGGAQCHAKVRTGVASILTAKGDSKESISVVAAKAISMSPEGMGVPVSVHIQHNHPRRQQRE